MNSGKKLSILYFSGTGNTEYVVCEVERLLIKKGYDCRKLAADRLWSDSGLVPGTKANKDFLSQRLEEFLQGSDMLIMAYPTYASDIPKPLDELISILPEGGGMKLAVISTCAMMGGDCCLLPARKLEKHGYLLVLASYVKMPNNIKLPPINYSPIENGAKLNRFYDSAFQTIGRIVNALIKETRIIEGKGLGSFLLGRVQRLSERFMGKFITKNMFVNNECIKCKLCVSTCPMANITFKDDKPHFGSNCCYCLRCYNFCPVSAIQVTKKTEDKKKYPRYKGFDRWKPPRLREIKNKGTFIPGGG